jgi:hypothetical protein
MHFTKKCVAMNISIHNKHDSIMLAIIQFMKQNHGSFYTEAEV